MNDKTLDCRSLAYVPRVFYICVFCLFQLDALLAQFTRCELQVCCTGFVSG